MTYLLKKVSLVGFGVIILGSFVNAQRSQNSTFISSKYQRSFDSLSNFLSQNGSFLNSVFAVEKTYFDSSIDEIGDKKIIKNIANIARSYCASNSLIKYKNLDSNIYLINSAIKAAIADTLQFDLKDLLISIYPFTYNFTDPFGIQDYTNTFVTKLLQTHKGNCRSLAYLYKILADELGAKCWLALAPNHIYIKNYSQKIGWYNTELTSGTFPTDAWIMTTGYVNPEAIKTGLYMDTLSNQQAIALCVLDLAKGYERQTHNYYDGFILKCCDLVLKYHPVNPMALLLKAETLKKVYLHEKEIRYPKPTVTESQMTEAYITLAKLGYREMSDRMYQKWLKSIIEQKEKYSNKKVTKPSLKLIHL